MTVLLSIEASRPNGAFYRVAIGCTLLPLASLVAAIVRLIM
jgi:hypothetical protein